MKDGLEPFFLTSEAREHENYFCRTILDRKSEKRVDANWFNLKQKQPTSVYILFSNLRPLAVSDGSEDDFSYPRVKLRKFFYEDIKEYLDQTEKITLVFLGVEIGIEPQAKGSNLPTLNGKSPDEDDGLVAWFALSIDATAAEEFIQKHQGCYFIHPPMPTLLHFSENEAGKVPLCF